MSVWDAVAGKVGLSGGDAKTSRGEKIAGEICGGCDVIRWPVRERGKEKTDDDEAIELDPGDLRSASFAVGGGRLLFSEREDGT